MLYSGHELSLRKANGESPRWEKQYLYEILGGNDFMSEPETGQERWLEQWADRIHGSGLSVIAVPLLEIGRGLGFLASQALLLTQPIVTGLVDEASFNRCVRLLEDPAALERLIERIERKAEDDG